MNWSRDITFCDFKKCDRKDTCYRYEEEHQLGDSVFMFEDDYDSKNCEYYFPKERKNVSNESEING